MDINQSQLRANYFTLVIVKVQTIKKMETNYLNFILVNLLLSILYKVSIDMLI